MSEQLLAGAPMLWPGRVCGVGPLHLGRTEARRKSEPALIGICPASVGLELTRAPKTRWWRRSRWCEDCKAYADYLRSKGQL